MIGISYLRSDNLSFGRTCEEQKLVELMRSHVGNNAAEVFFIKKPFGSNFGIHTMRPHAECLNDCTNCARLDEFTCFHNCAILKAFAVHNRINVLGFSLYAPHFG